MSSSTTGLTSIRKASESDVSSHSLLQAEALKNRTPEVDHGLAIRLEIETLEIQRESIKSEIDSFTRQRNQNVLQINSELLTLRKNKMKLIQEVKTIGKVLFILREAKTKGKISFDEFFKGREDVLVKFSAAVSKRVAGKVENLNTLSQRLEEEKNLALEMTDYATLLLETSYNRLSEVAEAERRSSIVATKVLADRKYLKFETIRFNKLLAKYWNREGSIRKTKEEIAKMKSDAEEYVKKITNKANKLAKDIKVANQKVRAKEEFQVKEAERLSEWERGLKDKEGAIRRLADEVKGWQK